MFLTHSRWPEHAVLSSITSGNIKKITLVWIPRCDSPPGIAYWEAYNRPLCSLADRLGSKRELEVEFKLTDEEAEVMAVVDSLAEFEEKGRMVRRPLFIPFQMGDVGGEF